MKQKISINEFVARNETKSWKNVKIMKLIIHKYDDSNGAKTMEKKSKLS